MTPAPQDDPVTMLRVYPEPTPASEIRVALHDAVNGNQHELIACCDALRAILHKAKQVARGKIPVLIHGETGTGKELIARFIHQHSPRREHAFVQVNCAAFSEMLIESELFGHEKGAFTGADQKHLGYFERADEGSILLDEIGEMPLKLQAKLLRVLEEEAFERVGGEKMVNVNLRVIATTNRDLEQEVARGRFRSDLYFRLNTVTLHLPPLRTRRDEIPLLAQHFLERYGNSGVPPVRAIAPKVLKLLLEYSWPGNIRQLRNVIHHACIMAQAERVELSDLPALTEAGTQTGPATSEPSLAEIERRVILDTLRDVGGNRTAAALRLGITTRTLQNKLKLYRANAA